MQNQFSTTFAPKYGSSRIDLGHEFKFTCKFGQLIPVQLTPVLPGDIMRNNTEVLARFAPLIAPIMHRVNLYTYSFYIPNRIIWDHFKEWITGQPYTDPNGNQVVPSFPRIIIDDSNWEGHKESSLSDYLGVPPPSESPVNPLELSILPFRAYQCVYNEYFRNQDVEPDLKFTTYSTTDVPTDVEKRNFYQIQYKNWEKDYFTSSFTQPQSGDPVAIPIDIQAALEYVQGAQTLRSSLGTVSGSKLLGVQDGNMYAGTVDVTVDGSQGVGYLNSVGRQSVALDVSNTLRIGSITNMTTIADLYYARQLQNFLNLEKRGGTRYIEILKSFFNVVSSDARLQRPQFLGGGKTPLVVSEVLQTSETTDTSALGDYAGRIIAASDNKHGFKSHFFEEHGYILTLMTILPRSSYQQGIERHWTYDDRLEYYWPQFAHLQEQPVYMKELFVNWKNLGPNPDDPTSDPVSNDDVFGYQARYMEYRTQYSRVAGAFRSSLNFWHMGRIFSNPPQLNKNFCSTRTSRDTFLRPFAVQDGSDYVYVEMYHDLLAIRKMPKYVYPKF